MNFRVRKASDNSINYIEINNLIDLIDLQIDNINNFEGSNRETYFEKCNLIIDFIHREIIIYDDYIE